VKCVFAGANRCFCCSALRVEVVAPRRAGPGLVSEEPVPARVHAPWGALRSPAGQRCESFSAAKYRKNPLTETRRARSRTLSSALTRGLPLLVLVLSAAVLVLVLEWRLQQVRRGRPFDAHSVWAAFRNLRVSMRKISPVLPAKNASQRCPQGRPQDSQGWSEPSASSLLVQPLVTTPDCFPALQGRP
jgi:hypothetical protein